MAARLDSFGLTELAARPEDAFRLAGLAMAEGRRIPGYGGDYYFYRIGVTSFTIRQTHWQAVAAWVSMPSSASSPLSGSRRVRITAAASPIR